MINLAYPSTIDPLAELINQTPMEVWQAYLAFHLVARNAAYLATAIDDANFEFFGKVLRGQPEQRERWRRAVSLVSGSQGLGDAIGQVYVARYFPAESRAMMQELVERPALGFERAGRRAGLDGGRHQREGAGEACGFPAEDRLSGRVQRFLRRADRSG